MPQAKKRNALRTHQFIDATLRGKTEPLAQLLLVEKTLIRLFQRAIYSTREFPVFSAPELKMRQLSGNSAGVVSTKRHPNRFLFSFGSTRPFPVGLDGKKPRQEVSLSFFWRLSARKKSSRRKLDDLALGRWHYAPVPFGLALFCGFVIVLPKHRRGCVPHHERQSVYVPMQSEPV